MARVSINKKPKLLSTRMELIDPARAGRYLELSAGNRDITQAQVQWLADVIRRGEWRPHLDNIKFNESGRLMDGHHRLLAIQEVGTPVYAQVQRGLDDAAWSYLNTGKTKSLTQELRVRREMKNANLYSSYLKMAVQLLTPESINLKVASEFERWEELFPGLGPVVDILASSHDYRGAAIGGALVFAYPAHTQRILEFAKKLRTEEGLFAGDPAYVFTRWWRRHHSRKDTAKGGGKAQRHKVYAPRVLACARRAVEKEDMLKLTTRGDDHLYFLHHYDMDKVKELIPEKVSPSAELLRRIQVDPDREE